MGLGPTLIPLNFEGDLDHHLDTKKSGFCHLLYIMCLGRGLNSLSALVSLLVPLPNLIDSLILTSFNLFTMVLRMRENISRGHGGAVVTHSPPTSEGGWF